MSDFVRRRRRLRAAGVLCLTLAIALAWLLIAGLFDRLLALPSQIRLATGALLVLLMIGALARIVQLLRSRRFDRLIAAAQIEAISPELRDRLVTVVTQQALPETQRGSAALTRIIASGVTDSLARRPPESLLGPRLIAPAIGALVVVLTLTLALLFVPWLGLPRLLARQVLPLADLPPVTTTRIDVITRSVDLPQGQSLAIVADVARGDGQCTLLVGADEQSLQPVAMPRAFADRYAVTLPGVERDLLYRIRAGDARSEAYQVRVLRRPALAKLRVTLIFPAYLHRDPLSFDTPDGRIEAVRGTRINARIQSTEPLKDARLLVDRQPVTTIPTIDPFVRESEFTVGDSGAWSIDLISDRDVHGGGFDDMSIIAVDDRPPIVQFVRSDLRLHPSDVIAVPFQAIDDFGIESLRLDVQTGNKTILSRATETGPEPRLVRDVATFDLAPSALGFGDIVTLTLTAVDGAGQTRASPPCRVLLSPRSVDARVLRRIDAIFESLRLAETLPRQPGDAPACVRALLRAISISDETRTSDFLERQIDLAQQLTSVQVWGQSALAPRDLETARQLIDSLRALYRAEQARLLIAELENIRSAQDQKKDLSQPEQAAVRQSIERAQAEADARVRLLELDPAAPDLPQRLKAFIDAADELARQRKNPTAQAIAGAWVKQNQPSVQRDRLAILAQAQVLRADSDLVWARDLQLIARAMSQLQDRAGDRPAEMVRVVRALEILHQATRNNPDDRAKLIEPAEAARKQLELWTDDPPEDIAARSRLEEVLAQSARLQEQHHEPLPDAGAEPDNASDTWQPPAANANPDDPAGSRAGQLSSIAQAQQRLNRRTESATSEAASRLGAHQQRIAEALEEVEADQPEDFFDPDDTPQREQALEALRDAQRALADLPQRLMELRRQAETIEAMRQSMDRASADAATAPESDRPAAVRVMIEAGRQLEEARRQIAESTSGASSETRASLQDSASRLGALGKPMIAGNQQLGSAMDSLQQQLVDADLHSAEQEQSRVLNAVAELQATLRLTQRKTIDRDPVVAARFFARKAAGSLNQQLPDMPQARDDQKQTGAALDRAWDAAFARSVQDKLQQLPAFQGLLTDDLAFDFADAQGPARLDRTISAEWGRLRENRDLSAAAGSAAPIPPGYEEPLRRYFQALDQARSGETKP